jgi:DNA-binding NarL/FixJ family response regulator
MPGSDLLSERELEVTRLVVEGLSNQEVARALSLSNRTVQAHVSSALRKTSTTTRTQLAVWALRTGTITLGAAESDDQ